MTLLVVDDETAILQGTERRLRRFLASADTILCAESASQALKLFSAHLPDIVLLDIRLQDMDGLTLLSRLQTIPHLFACLIISAYDQFDYARTAMRLGADDFLVKPYTVTDLESAVRKAWARLLARRETQSIQWERQLHGLLHDGKVYTASDFGGMQGENAPSLVRILTWNKAPESFYPFAHWHIFSLPDGCALISGSLEEITIWVSQMPDIHWGLSQPGTDLSQLYKEACAALEYSLMPQMPFLTVYCEAFQASRRPGSAAAFAMDYVQKHLDTEISMDDIVHQLHTNYSYFSRQFKQQTGESFSQYVLTQQMQWAYVRLTEGYRVSELADKLGYRSVESFSKAFARIYGSSPRNYLQKKGDLS